LLLLLLLHTFQATKLAVTVK